MRAGRQAGFSLVEFLVALTVSGLALAGLASVTLQHSRVTKAQRLRAEAQCNARISLSMVVEKLRSAGWNPMNGPITAVALDPDTSDDVSQIELFADLDEDSATTSLDEAVLIRHIGNEIQWRRVAGGSFEVVATNISNDANGDGTPEAMFLPDSTTNPSRITVRITAESAVPDPSSGLPARYTLATDVALRNGL